MRSSCRLRVALWFCCVAFVVVGCGGTSTSHLAGITTPQDYWEQIAPTCAGYPSKENCNDGDMTLFGGLLCASGDERGCALVRDSQGRDGRWWRSPRRVGGNLGENNSFSRDMSLGVMLYLATTRDRNAAEAWLSWIEDHRPCVTRNPVTNGCMVRGVHRFCSDDSDQRCSVTPTLWGVLGRVFDALDLPKNTEMRLNNAVDNDALWLKAQQAPLGYETHLPAVEVLLKRQLDQARESRERAATILADRQPDNPFFGFLKGLPRDQLMSKVIALCPKDGDTERRNQWSWERNSDTEAWRESMGWDCLFMANLLSQP